MREALEKYADKRNWSHAYYNQDQDSEYVIFNVPCDGFEDAKQALTSTEQAAQQAEARIYNQAIRDVLALERPAKFDWIDIPEIKQLLKPEGGV